MTKYKYKQVSIEADHLEDYLNRRGEQGWRVRFVEHGHISNYLVLFERVETGNGKKHGRKAP